LTDKRSEGHVKASEQDLSLAIRANLVSACSPKFQLALQIGKGLGF